MIDLPSVRPPRHVTTLSETIARTLLPDNLMIETKHRHSCSWKAEKNRALYLACKGKPISGQDGKLWEDVSVEDFAEYRKAGLTHPMMSEVERSLGVSQ